jgi:hyperosmotically inducible periplasmic protein
MRRGVHAETAMSRYLAIPLLFVLMLAGCRTNESPEQQVNDLEITASVKSKLASDVGLSTVPNISVNSTNGVVTLSGQVNTAEQRAKAESIARSTPHVVRVVDNLQLAARP